MKTITFTLTQLLLFIGFIFIFTYFWLPQNNTSDEYITLLEKYNRLLVSKSKYKNEVLRLSSQHPVGKKLSAHTSTIVPSYIHDNDNNMVSEILR